MVASDEVDKIDNFWHKRFWKLLDLRDRNFSNCHNDHLHQNRQINRRKTAYPQV